MRRRALRLALAIVAILTTASSAAAAAQSPSVESSQASVASPPLSVEPLRIGERWRGRLSDTEEVARLGFTLQAQQHLGLRLAQSPASDVEVSLSSGGRELWRQRAFEPGTAIDVELWLGAGEYLIAMRPTVAAGGRQRLLVSRLDPFEVPPDVEPNDHPSHARDVPATLRWEGAPSGSERDLDAFWLPALAAPGDIRLRVSGEPPVMHLYADGERTTELPLVGTDDGVFAIHGAPVGGRLLLEIEAEGPYQVEAEAPGWTPADDVLAPPLELELEVDAFEGVECAPTGARLAGRLTLTNVGAEPLELELRTASSDPSWRIGLQTDTAILDPGAAVVVPLSVTVMPGACGVDDVALSVAAVASDGGLASTTLTLDAAVAP